MSKNTRNRILLTAVAALLLVTMAVGGTLAWLTASTTPVVNTFESNDVEVDLDETTGTDYEFIPGVDIEKDPKVTVTATVDAFVFLQVIESENWPEDATYSLILDDPDTEAVDGWTLVPGETNVYYREVAADTTDMEYYIITGNTIEVSEDMDKADMALLTEDASLSFQAWIIQKANGGTLEDPEYFTAAEAWDEVKPATTSGT